MTSCVSGRGPQTFIFQLNVVTYHLVMGRPAATAGAVGLCTAPWRAVRGHAVNPEAAGVE